MGGGPRKRISVPTPLTIMADSGASVNVLDERDYRALTNRPMVKQTKVRIHPCKSSKPLTVLGKFTITLKFKSRCIKGKIYVVQGSGGSLLSWKTSQQLGPLKQCTASTKIAPQESIS